MHICVTGSAGFIGFNVARALLEEGHTVVGVDNFNPYYSVQLKHDRDAVLRQYSGYESTNLDLADRERLNALLAEQRPGAICHLAAQAGVRYSLTHPFVYGTANLDAFLNLLEACRHAAPQPRLVYASSSSVYGGNTKLPFSETDNVDAPVSLYAATKKANELMAHAYSHLYGLQTIGLRFFTVYGPWGRPDMAMWLFTDAMIHGREIKVFNHGDMRRDFTYIDDIVQGVKASLFQPDLDRYEIFNLGNHRSENLMDMIRLLARTVGTEPNMKLLPMQPGDVPATYADIARARTRLGFEPATPIAEGIPRFVRWFREYHDV